MAASLEGDIALKFLIAALLVGSLGKVAFAAGVDYSSYELTESQLQLLDRLKERGFTEEQLRKAAETFEKSNRPQPEVYIPEHTWEELLLVTEWAKGGAYLGFAHDAGLEFDREAYLEDCPNVALFQFGKASGTEFLRSDVMTGYYNTAYMLGLLQAKLSKEEFRQRYLELIEQTPFAKYLR